VLPLLATEFDPVSEFTQFISNPYVNLPGPFDINKAVLYLWLSAAIAIVGTLVVVRRGLAVRPGRRQTALEAVYDLTYTQIAKAGLPEEGMRLWFPYVASLFVFIWVMNLVGFIPLPVSDEHVHIFGLEVPQLQIYAATANISVTLALTAVTILASHIEGIRFNGPIGYFRSWMPSGLPQVRPLRPASIGVGVLVGLIAVIEVISQFARIISLSVRLFANLLAGHLVIAVFLALAGILTSSLVYWPIQLLFGVPIGVAIYLLEVTLIAGLQAFIFATLSAIYIGGAIHPDH
jgi:F-type H+-transporting ATPase subunit a